MLSLQEKIKAIRGVRILVAGEVGIDEYLFGNTHRISPEAPVPVVEVQSTTHKLGMSGNVAENILSLGGDPLLIGVRGNDSEGEQLEKLMEERGLTRRKLISDPSRPTLKKIRVIAQRQHLVRVDFERTHALDPKVAKQFLEQICDEIPSCDGIILQDYGKGLWNPDTVSFVGVAKSHRKPVFVDPSRHQPLSLYRGATLMTPNVSEACDLSGIRLKGGFDKAQLSTIALKLLEGAELAHSVITCGEHGMVALSQNQKGERELKHIPTLAREVFDVTGAGDTVIAVMAMLLARGSTLEEAMQVANQAAAIVVGRVGASHVTPEELVSP